MPKQETKRPPGRPPMQKGAAKNAVVQIRFSDSEKSRFEKVAKKEGLTLSDWARQTLKNAVD